MRERGKNTGEEDGYLCVQRGYHEEDGQGVQVLYGEEVKVVMVGEGGIGMTGEKDWEGD